MVLTTISLPVFWTMVFLGPLLDGLHQLKAKSNLGIKPFLPTAMKKTCWTPTSYSKNQMMKIELLMVFGAATHCQDLSFDHPQEGGRCPVPNMTLAQ
jgi:hypothetical protein